MTLTPKFCGKCGVPVKQGARFCGGCGAAVVQSPGHDPGKSRDHQENPPVEDENKTDSSPSNKPKSVCPVSSKIPGECDSFLSLNAIASGWQWAVVWLIGWLPVGILFAYLYDRRRALNPEFYSNYPRQWSSTLPGMMTAYGVGALLGGFIAGLIIYRIMNRKKISIGFWGIFPALGWAILWLAVLQPLSFTDDGTLIIAIPILGILFSILFSRISIWLLCRKYKFSATSKEKKLVAIGWAMCSLVGSFMAMAFSGI